MKRLALGTLVLAASFACGTAATSEPTASPNAATQSQTTTTGATTVKQQGTSSGYSQSTVGKGMPGAGDKSSISSAPEKVGPATTLGVPRTPAPSNTGDPCGPCPERR